MRFRTFVITSLLVLPVFLTGSVQDDGSMVDVGGFKVFVRDRGTSSNASPTVVFENGLGTTLQSWTRVQEEVAKDTRAIAYDRAGIGKSEIGPQPPTPANVASQLHALLARMGAPPPYVMVGHSYGAPLSHAFAATYPNEVAGLVYVDPTDFTQTSADIQGLYDKAGAPDGRAWMENLYEQSLKSAPPGLQAEIRQLMQHERDAFSVFRQMHTAPDIPIVVLLAGKDPAAPPGATFPGSFAEFASALSAQRTDHFRRLVRRSTNGVLVLVGPSGHFIQSTEPDLVVGAIQRVLKLAKQRRPQ